MSGEASAVTTGGHETPAPEPRPEVVEFLRHLQDERQLSPNTVSAYGRDLADLEGFLTEFQGTPEWDWAGVDRLSLRSFLGWCSARGLAQRTIARKL
jgi:integrase/recombinase XerC